MARSAQWRSYAEYNEFSTESQALIRDFQPSSLCFRNTVFKGKYLKCAEI